MSKLILNEDLFEPIEDVVSVEIPSANGRNLTFGDVVVRVSDSYALAMHIDTDEANAAGMAPNTIGAVIK